MNLFGFVFLVFALLCIPAGLVVYFLNYMDRRRRLTMKLWAASLGPERLEAYKRWVRNAPKETTEEHAQDYKGGKSELDLQLELIKEVLRVHEYGG